MNPGNEPTEKQLAVIRRLAKGTKSDIDVDSITSKKEASRIIDELIARKNGNGKDNGNGNADCRERKVVYGLSVKLVFARYQQINTNYRTEGFWDEVDEFYRQYLEHQDRAVKSGSQG